MSLEPKTGSPIAIDGIGVEMLGVDFRLLDTVYIPRRVRLYQDN